VLVEEIHNRGKGSGYYAQVISYGDLEILHLQAGLQSGCNQISRELRGRYTVVRADRRRKTTAQFEKGMRTSRLVGDRPPWIEVLIHYIDDDLIPRYKAAGFEVLERGVVAQSELATGKSRGGPF
jgi:hypothetical protein